ncbi:MAG: glycosyltransferase [Moorea sp. SIO2I5]|nr:glycosyltransferase [Moorena sp. SIO2I5]
MRLLIIQYAGDYRKTFEQLANGGAETYYAQKYCVDAVAEIGKQIGEVATLCCMTEKPYNELLEKGVRAIGAGFDGKINIKKLIQLVEDYHPTHLIIRTPIREIFRWAINNAVPTLALFAESIPTNKVVNKFRNYLLSQLLNNNRIQWIGSYGIDSSLGLQHIGVQSDKIIPWSYIVTETPESWLPKTLRAEAKSWQICYVGSMNSAKGVGDILESIANLKAKKFPIKLKLAGYDKTGFFANKAKQLQIEDCVEFLGLVPSNTVVTLMRESDLVLVPSRHEFPEGFPLVITHALCARTPIIASDHPMFINKLKDGISAKIFEAGNSVALAESIQKLLSDSDLYHNLSIASYETWKSLQLPVKFADLIQRWLHDSPENEQWLIEHRLSSGRYNSISP